MCDAQRRALARSILVQLPPASNTGGNLVTPPYNPAIDAILLTWYEGIIFLSEDKIIFLSEDNFIFWPHVLNMVHNSVARQGLQTLAGTHLE